MNKNNQLGLIFLVLGLFPLNAYSQGNNGGAANPNAVNPTEAIADLEQQIADLDTELSGEIDLLELELQQSVTNLQNQIDAGKFSELTADCSVDGQALQQAVDLAPAEGAIITVNGNCESTVIFAKQNLIIDGGGSATISGNPADDTSAALYIEASNAIQISGITAEANGDTTALLLWSSQAFLFDTVATGGEIALDINRGSTVIAANVTASIPAGAGPALMLNNASLLLSDESLSILNPTTDAGTAAYIAFNSTYRQASGHLTTQGAINIRFGGSVLIKNANMTSPSPSGVFFMQRNASLLVRPDAGDVVNITPTATPARPLWMFSGSHVFLNAVGGTINISGDQLIIQRTSSLLQSGNVNMGVALILNQENTVWSIFAGPTFDPIPDVVTRWGSGVRNASSTALTTSCDASAWVANNVTCAP